MTEAIVLGAGMVGVSTAIALRDRGWDVTIIDRKPPGQETSFGNAGIIQSECVEPYAMPRSRRELFNIATGRSNDVNFAMSELPWHLQALSKYWWHSEGTRHQKISITYAKLIGRAIGTHAPLIDRAGAHNLVHQSGYRILFRDPKALEQGIASAERRKTGFGTPYIAMDAAATLKHEPALRQGGAGSVYWPEPWTVRDPGDLVTAYSELFCRNGGRLVQASIDAVDRFNRGWRVSTSDGAFDAAHLVIALGPWSPELLKKHGLRIPMIFKRGYHAHYVSPHQLSIATLDNAYGYMIAPMRNGSRMTTGAHLTMPGKPPIYRQLERAERAAEELFDLGERVEKTPWSGTRPCMPDMLPVIGPVKSEPGLWLNFGHGHQGFTLGPASAEILSAMMAAETPPVDPEAFRPERFLRSHFLQMA